MPPEAVVGSIAVCKATLFGMDCRVEVTNGIVVNEVALSRFGDGAVVGGKKPL